MRFVFVTSLGDHGLPAYHDGPTLATTAAHKTPMNSRRPGWWVDGIGCQVARGDIIAG